MIDGDRLRALIQQWKDRAERMAANPGVPGAAVMVLSMCAEELEAALAIEIAVVPEDRWDAPPLEVDEQGRFIVRQATHTTRTATPEPEDAPT